MRTNDEIATDFLNALAEFKMSADLSNPEVITITDARNNKVEIPTSSKNKEHKRVGYQGFIGWPDERSERGAELVRSLLETLRSRNAGFSLLLYDDRINVIVNNEDHLIYLWE